LSEHHSQVGKRSAADVSLSSLQTLADTIAFFQNRTRVECNIHLNLAGVILSPKNGLMSFHRLMKASCIVKQPPNVAKVTTLNSTPNDIPLRVSQYAGQVMPSRALPSLRRRALMAQRFGLNTNSR